MPLLRGRRDDGGTKYQMREKMFAIGDDYWIETDGGERAFKVNGKAVRIRDTYGLPVPRKLTAMWVPPGDQSGSPLQPPGIERGPVPSAFAMTTVEQSHPCE